MGVIWNWIRRDGLLHIETCALVAIVFSLFLPWWASCVLALIAGLGKELWDTKYGVANWHDVLCDILGVIVGVIISVL